MNGGGKRTFDAVVFDLDGVLVDSERIYFQAWQIGAETLGCREVLPVFERIIGLPFDDAKEMVRERLGPDTALDDFLEVVSRALQPLLVNGYLLKAGVFEVLDHLQDLGIPCAVATSSTETVPVKLRDNGIEHYFRHVVRRDQVARGKPHPDLYEEAARRLQLPPGRCLAVEDSEPGLRAAMAAGLPMAHVPDIARVSAELLEACTAIVPDLHGLRDWLTASPKGETLG